jgi:hypothetical protein
MLCGTPDDGDFVMKIGMYDAIVCIARWVTTTFVTSRHRSVGYRHEAQTAVVV